MTRTLPSGTVTMLFTDIEGSTRLLDQLGDGYGPMLADHRRLLRAVWARHEGVEVGTEGDSFFVAFTDVESAVDAAIAAQRALAAHAWPSGGGADGVRVRMGLHTGEPRLDNGDYWGADVHYAARVGAAANGGQVLASQATRALDGRHEFESLGEHSLKDFIAPRELFHLVVDGTGRLGVPATADAGTDSHQPAIARDRADRPRGRAGGPARSPHHRAARHRVGPGWLGQDAAGARGRPACGRGLRRRVVGGAGAHP